MSIFELEEKFDSETLQILVNGGYSELIDIADAADDELALIGIPGPLSTTLIETARSVFGVNWHPRDKEKIALSRYSDSWPGQFQTEKQRLQTVLQFVAIEHIGSTAVPGLIAKPIIDIMVGISSFDDFEDVKKKLISLQYGFESLRENWGLFSKFQPNSAFNLHVTETGSQFWREKLLFRDYLRSHPDDVTEYAELKLHLADKYRGVIAYSNAKSQFIGERLKRAQSDAE